MSVTASFEKSAHVLGDEGIQRYAAEVKHGQRWLRFTPDIEAQFQVDTSQQRFRYLLACMVIGAISLLLGIANEKDMIPNTIDQVMPWWIGLLVFFGVAAGWASWMGPMRMCRDWLMDKVAAFEGVLLACGIVLASNSDPVLTSTVHASNVVLIVMWFCILCRLRFRISLLSILLTVGMYVLLAKAPSPVQQMIVQSNVKIMLFTALFALVVNYVLEFRERRSFLLRKLETLQCDALGQAREELRQLSMQDPLTGLHNRRQFEADFDIAWSKARFARQPVGLLLLDVDYFKLFNDTYGHPAGDACLTLIAGVLKQVASDEGGSAARIGGEEFVLLLPGKTLEGVQRAAQAIREGLRVLALEHSASAVAPHVTVSGGGVSARAASGPSIAMARQSLINEADAALYAAKDAGRDQVMVRSSMLANDPGSVETDLSETEAPSSTDTDVVPLPMIDPRADAMASLTQVIKSKFYSLRFTPALEAQYQSEQVSLRYRYLLASGLLGNLIIQVYWQFNFHMISDVADWFRPLLWMLGGGLLAGVAINACPIKPWLRECVFALGVTASAVLFSVAFARSRLPSAYAGYLIVFLVPMFGCVAARQPFRYAVIPSLISLAAFALLASPDSRLEQVMTWDVSTRLLTATFFILMASYSMDYGERMDYLLERLGMRQREALKATVESLHKLSTTDALTGISNRRHFETEFAQCWARSPGQPISMLILDVDHFKCYNDGYGHPAGDACLQKIAALVQGLADREGCMLARLGGEEFGMLMPGFDEPHALRVGHEICAVVSAAKLPHLYSKVAANVTVSVGVATLMVGDQRHAGSLMALADEALYGAKAKGRNSAMCAGQAQDIQPLSVAQAAC